MRLVKLVKLSWNTVEGSQTRYFFKARDAAFYMDIHKIQTFIQTSPIALQSGNDYCLVERLTGYASNAHLKARDKIYEAREADACIELGNPAADPTNGNCLYLSETGDLYKLRQIIKVEPTPQELKNIEASYDGAVALAQRNIFPDRIPGQQPTLFQFWGQPSPQQSSLTQAGWWPTTATQRLVAQPGWLSAAPQPSTGSDDPMDISSSSTGYTRPGYTGYSSY